MAHKIYKLAEEAGITAKELAAALRQLSANALDPIKIKYPDMVINKARAIPLDEGFKLSRDQGQAAVIQFTKTPVEDLPDVAVWIKENVPFTQLQLQYFENTTTGKLTGAIGIAYGSTLNVPPIATTVNGTVMTPNIARYTPK
jgi:hypothetical protein